MNILHTTTDPDLLTRLREMLRNSKRWARGVGWSYITRNPERGR